jgi:signal transduction histidine kinase
MAARVAELSASLSATLALMERGSDSAGGDGEHSALAAKARADFAELWALVGDYGELSSLCAYLQASSEHEKAALARELHDGLGGILTPAKMDVAWMRARLVEDPAYRERVVRLDALIDQAIDLKRGIIEALRPSLLDHLGLASALQWYVEEVSREAGLEPRLHIGKDLERLPPDLEIALYRLVQESVSNVVRHAKARHLDLTLERTARGLELTVSDDGVGIAGVKAARALSHGLAGMSRRARSIDATFQVHSAPGKGTRIEVSVPLPAAASAAAKA